MSHYIKDISVLVVDKPLSGSGRVAHNNGGNTSEAGIGDLCSSIVYKNIGEVTKSSRLYMTEMPFQPCYFFLVYSISHGETSIRTYAHHYHLHPALLSGFKDQANYLLPFVRL